MLVIGDSKEIEGLILDEIRDQETLTDEGLRAVSAIAKLYQSDPKLARTIERGLISIANEKCGNSG